jgi:hypothetical protein
MTPQDPADQARPADDEQQGATNRENDSVASKLSKELSNWRQRRTHNRPRRDDGPIGNDFKSDVARTIKVRGHETLVVRKAKVAHKVPATTHDSHR